MEQNYPHIFGFLKAFVGSSNQSSLYSLMSEQLLGGMGSLTLFEAFQEIPILVESPVLWV